MQLVLISTSPRLFYRLIPVEPAKISDTNWSILIRTQEEGHSVRNVIGTINYIITRISITIYKSLIKIVSSTFSYGLNLRRLMYFYKIDLLYTFFSYLFVSFFFRVAWPPVFMMSPFMRSQVRPPAGTD